MAYTAEQKLECVTRELKYRVRVYERFVADGKMTRRFADEQIALMQAIRDDYAAIAANDRLL